MVSGFCLDFFRISSNLQISSVLTLFLNTIDGLLLKYDNLNYPERHAVSSDFSGYKDFLFFLPLKYFNAEHKTCFSKNSINKPILDESKFFY